MNREHPNLKFEIEKPAHTPKGNTISLLDFTVTIIKDGDTEFDFYKKKAKKPIFIHHKSALPRRTNLHTIRNERERINQRCSTRESRDKHNNDFDETLSLNGYPQHIIDEISPEEAPTPHKIRHNNNNADCF